MQVVAKITSRYKSRQGYVELPVARVSNYAIEGNLDTDADSWSVDIGDPRSELIDLLQRDNEVRVTLVGGSSSAGIRQLQMGFADIIAITHEGVLSLQGRDVTAVAVDSTAPPQKFPQARPNQIVMKQGRPLGLPAFNLAIVKQFPTIYTDGSESYWSFWYRMYRRRKMWMYAEPDGTLIAGDLNYTEDPTYFFGNPDGVYPDDGRWIPTSTIEVRKNTQTRIGEVWILGDTGQQTFTHKEKDPTIQEWIKKPLKILTEQVAGGRAEAKKEALEEIFESKVGSIEVTIMIKDPGMIIRQNRVARLNFPSIDYGGDFFVVGSRLLGGTSGFQQEIRLREKQFAVTNRIPKAPTLKKGANLPESGAGGGINLDIGKSELNGYFLEAANEWHGIFKRDTFLGVLLAICEQETGFRNVRNQGIIEWYNEPDPGEVRRHNGDINAEVAKWRELFANEPNNRLNPDYPHQKAVGYMQLYSQSFKDKADEIGGKKGEYDGGRWQARANIMAGGYALNQKAAGLGGKDSEIWKAVASYGEGQTYANEVKKRYDEKWRNVVSVGLAEATASGNINLPYYSTGTLIAKVLSNNQIVWMNPCQRTDVAQGRIHRKILECILAFVENGFPTTINALKCDHSIWTTEKRLSAHGDGRAVDFGGWTEQNARRAMEFFLNNQVAMGLVFNGQDKQRCDQLIGPLESLCRPSGWYDTQTLGEHKGHIHVGIYQR